MYLFRLRVRKYYTMSRCGRGMHVGEDVLFLVSKVIVIKIAADGVTRLALLKGQCCLKCQERER